MKKKKNTFQLKITVNGKPEWEGKDVWLAVQNIIWIGKRGDEVCFFVEGIEYNLPPQEKWHFLRWNKPIDRDIRQWLVDHIKVCIELHQEFYLEGEKNNDK